MPIFKFHWIPSLSCQDSAYFDWGSMQNPDHLPQDLEEGQCSEIGLRPIFINDIYFNLHILSLPNIPVQPNRWRQLFVLYPHSGNVITNCQGGRNKMVQRAIFSCNDVDCSFSKGEKISKCNSLECSQPLRRSNCCHGCWLPLRTDPVWDDISI